MRVFIAFNVLLIGVVFPITPEIWASDFSVYSVYRGLNLGNGEERQEKDYYLNMGSKHGVHEGSILQVLRKTPTYDLLSEQLYQEMTFPIAFIKVIHVEAMTSVARLEKLIPDDKNPIVSPRSVMIGDLVRIPELGLAP